MTPLELPGLAQDADGPVFAEPWEAQVFAMAVALHEAGVFTWSEWSECLGAVLKADPYAGYYDRWLTALEQILADKKVAGAPELTRCADAWRDAAARTPHGAPITL